MTGKIQIAPAELEALIVQTLVASRTSETNAASVARALTQAEVDGQAGHGFSRVPSYAAQARSGKVDGFAIPSARQSRPAALVIDAAHGFAYPALDMAIGHLPGLAREAGIAAAGITRSHHFGVAGRAVERLAELGFVALILGNTPQAMAAWGGRRPVFGTNPLGFAAPRRSEPPLVIDLAMSEAARAKVVAAAAKGEIIPQGWALDADGQPTTDARAALHGSLLPAGGAKGSALALMIEVLAAALVGANFAFEASSFFEAEGKAPGVGQLLIAIDPGAFAGATHFGERLESVLNATEGDSGARLPGASRLAARAKAAEHGLEVDARLLAEVRAVAGESG